MRSGSRFSTALSRKERHLLPHDQRRVGLAWHSLHISTRVFPIVHCGNMDHGHQLPAAVGQQTLSSNPGLDVTVVLVPSQVAQISLALVAA